MAAEANQRMANGDKLVTTSLFRWKPDWDGAVMEYERAATCYRNAKMYSASKEAWKKAATANKNRSMPFSAGRNLEEAAAMAKEEKSLEEAASLLEHASLAYRENGNIEKASEVLCRGAKLVQDKDLNLAIEYFTKAIDLQDIEDKLHMHADTFKCCINLLLRGQRYQEAIELMEKQVAAYKRVNQFYPVHKLYANIIILHLAAEHYQAADDAYHSFLSTPSFPTSAEARLVMDMLHAFETGSGEALQAVLKSQTISFLDNNIIKIANNLVVSPKAKAAMDTIPVISFDQLIQKEGEKNDSAAGNVIIINNSSTQAAPSLDLEDDIC